ncbi:MAG: type II toxin-antitoxin system VapC family toxin, partial [Symploca sp. SIO1C4]|nr:type II toxin-antitoxin system VapC family toxin [Symploca sp. SIO1C4]
LHQISSLAVDESSVAQLANLPPLHRDPFDRMLICQALEKGLTIATVDKAVRDYSVSVM